MPSRSPSRSGRPATTRRSPDYRSEEARLLEQAKLGTLSELASYKLDDLLAELGVDVRRAGRLLVGCCPVHGGDNPTAFNLYPDGHTLRGNWKCRTKKCEKAFQPTLIGLVRGALSRRHHQWAGHPKDKMYDFKTTLQWLSKFVGQDWRTLRPDVAKAEKHRFLSEMATLHRALPQTPEDGWPRELVRGRLAVPSAHYQARPVPYSAEVLDRYDVGESRTTDPRNPMFGRVAVPVYDRMGARVVGVTGRSLWPQCPACRRWHDPAAPCPTGEALRYPQHAKWRNTPGFAREQHLYNLWFAKDHVRRTGRALLVEGQGEVWRLAEAGCEVGLGLFGVVLTDPQQVLLEASGAMEVVVALNADEAGRRGAAEIAEQLGRAFRVRVVTPPNNDLGETPVADVRDWLRATGLS